MIVLRETKEISGTWFLILFIILLVFILFLVIEDGRRNPILSRDEVCQKHFGKDYVWQSGYKSADFCIDSSGIPKYPKTWFEKK